MNNNNSTVKLITILDYIGILFILGVSEMKRSGIELHYE